MKKINPKILLAIFLGLAALAVVIHLIDRKKGERSFRSEMFELDSANIYSITVFKKGTSDTAYRLVRTGINWEVRSSGRLWPADSNSVRNALSALLQMKVSRVAGNNEKSWKTFDLTDSMSVRVLVEDGDGNADFRFGKVSFTQGQGQGYGRNQNIVPLTHIRLSGDDKVYVTEGFISMLFSDSPSMFRNRSLLRLDKEMINRLTFSYPGDSSFILIKEGDRWMTGGRLADSAKMAAYLQSLANLSWHEFADDVTPPFMFPFQLTIEGNNMISLNLKGFIIDEPKRYLVGSDFNPGALFASSGPGLFNRVFPSPSNFTGRKD